MASQGLDKQRRVEASRQFAPREVRSFEVEHVNSCWHLDFHTGSRSVLTAKGTWVKPSALCILDDRSRLICHVQWFLDETARTLVHGFCQALMRRALPRSLLTDNGAAMMAESSRTACTPSAFCIKQLCRFHLGKMASRNAYGVTSKAG